MDLKVHFLFFQLAYIKQEVPIVKIEVYNIKTKFKSKALAFTIIFMLDKISSIFKNAQSTYERYSFIGNIIIVNININENIGVSTREYKGPIKENWPLIIIVNGRFIMYIPKAINITFKISLFIFNWSKMIIAYEERKVNIKEREKRE